MEDDQQQQPESLLPYATWIEDALRQVVVRAITHVGVEGLPGGHHFNNEYRQIAQAILHGAGIAPQQ